MDGLPCSHMWATSAVDLIPSRPLHGLSMQYCSMQGRQCTIAQLLPNLSSGVSLPSTYPKMRRSDRNARHKADKTPKQTQCAMEECNISNVRSALQDGILLNLVPEQVGLEK
jgi:hypothetical protein